MHGGGFFSKKNKQAYSFIMEFRVGKRENLIGNFASKDPNGFKLNFMIRFKRVS